MTKPKTRSSNAAPPGQDELSQAQLVFNPGLISAPLRAGDTCPQCGKGRLDYDGMLNLACPACGFALGGSCT